MRYLIIFLSLITLTACATNSTTATSTVIQRDRSQLEVKQPGMAGAPPTSTPIPFPSPTPTVTPFALASNPTPTPMVTPAPESAAVQVEVTANALNLRQGPGLEYAPVGGVFAGHRFDVIGINPSGHWLNIVREDGSFAWISASPAYVRLLGAEPADLPVVDSLAASSSLPDSPSVTSSTPATQRPGTDPRNSVGKLVFATSSGGNLYVVNADSSDLRLLASGVIDPVISPEGRRVAFTRWDGAKFGVLYTINIDGSGEQAIVGDIRQPKSPTWSPDGQEIILSFQHGGRRDPPEECRQFDFDDGIRIPKDVAEVTSFQTTADGITVCYIRREDLRWGLRRIDIATGTFEDLAADPYSYNPAWDPQNPWRIIYDGDKGLMQLDVTSGNLWPISTDLRDTGPVFSPDGRRLAITYKQHDHWEVYTLDLATGQRQRLTKPPILADPQYNSAAPAWSPDGSRIAFLTDRTGFWELWVMNADGSDQRPLFSPELQAQLDLDYRGVNERMLNWLE